MAFCLFRFARLRGTVSVKEWLGVLINKTDRKIIENKYHRNDEPFNPLNRMEYHGIGYDEGTGKDDEEILAGLKELQPILCTMPHPAARATAI